MTLYLDSSQTEIINIVDIKNALLNLGDKLEPDDWDLFEKTIRNNRSGKNSDGKILVSGFYFKII